MPPIWRTVKRLLGVLGLLCIHVSVQAAPEGTLVGVGPNGKTGPVPYAHATQETHADDASRVAAGSRPRASADRVLLSANIGSAAPEGAREWYRAPVPEAAPDWLPPPGPWSAVVATLALAGFFFLRRAT